MAKDTPAERTQKAFKAVENTAKLARASVIVAQRNAAAETRRKAQEEQSREAKRLKREEHLPNSVIADRMNVSESTVRALLLLHIKGEV